MKITIYRFEAGDDGEFYVDGSAEVPVETIVTYRTRGASSVFEPCDTEVVTIDGVLCVLERENGKPCVFLPPKGRRRARRA